MIARLLMPDYPAGMITTVSFRTRLAIVATILAVVITPISFGIAHWIHREAATSYRERCSLYAFALASTSASWLPAPGEAADQLGYPLLSLGVVYIRATTDEDLAMDIRRPEFAQARLPLPDLAPFAAATMVRFENHWAVNVVVPYMVQGQAAESAEAGNLGSLQFGIDATELVQMNQRTTTIAASVSLAAWMLITAVLAYLPQRKGRRPVEDAEQCSTPVDASRHIVAGELVLCLDELQLEVSSMAVDLTPKQAAILELMMNHPGRAFSDADFLAHAWQASFYANSSDVKQQIYLIRKRLRDAGLAASEILVTVPGVGYKLNVSQDDGDVDALSTDKPHS